MKSLESQEILQRRRLRDRKKSVVARGGEENKETGHEVSSRDEEHVLRSNHCTLIYILFIRLYLVRSQVWSMGSHTFVRLYVWFIPVSLKALNTTPCVCKPLKVDDEEMNGQVMSSLKTCKKVFVCFCFCGKCCNRVVKHSGQECVSLPSFCSLGWQTVQLSCRWPEVSLGRLLLRLTSADMVYFSFFLSDRLAKYTLATVCYVGAAWCQYCVVTFVFMSSEN